MKKTILWLGVLAMVAGVAVGQPGLQETKDPNPPSGLGPGITPSGPCGPDAFGYTCDPTVPFTGADITGTGAFLVSGDDSSSGPVPLGGTGMFDFYGVTFTSLVAATNGYISTDPTDGGPDLSNDCPIPAPPSTGGGDRMYPLHDDLISDIYYEYQTPCPRTSDRGATGEGCHIFQWTNVTHFGGGGPWNQWAYLYDGGDFAFEVGPGNPEQGSGSTTGIQNLGATDGITVACNTGGSIPDNFAVFFFNPNFVPVPTMGEWALALFALVLLVIGALSLRAVRRNPAV